MPPVKLTALISLLQSTLPPLTKDVPFVYHKPRQLDLETANVGRLILSVAPTKGIYKTFHLPKVNEAVDVYFLHRPWKLVRHPSAKIWRRPRVVLSSHKVFDELLTVGWNVALAERLGLDVEQAICLQGYKGDPERKIGLIAPLKQAEILGSATKSSETEQRVNAKGSEPKPIILERIREQFGSIEKAIGFEHDESHRYTHESIRQPDEPIRIIAIMNAFHPAEIEWIATSAVQAGLIEDASACQEILCLTGEPRDEGISAAVERGMKVVCVGHRTCEDWGVRYLMQQVNLEFPSLKTILIDEPEDVVEPKVQPEQKKAPAPPSKHLALAEA